MKKIYIYIPETEKKYHTLNEISLDTLKVDEYYFIETATGKDILEYEYYEFLLKESEEYIKRTIVGIKEKIPEPVLVAANPSLGFCDNFQKKKIVLDIQNTPKFDIFSWGLTDLIVVKKELKIKLEDANFTGLKFIPCIISDESYSENDLEFSSDIEKGSSHYQLVITGRASGGIKIGDAKKIRFMADPVDLNMDYPSYSEPQDLLNVDFQEIWYCENSRGIKKYFQTPFVVISGDVQYFLKKEKVSGLNTLNSSNPKIENNRFPVINDPFKKKKEMHA